MNASIVRTVATAIVVGLSSAMVYYPHQYWMTAVLAAVGALGINVVPGVSQNRAPVVTVQPTPTMPKQPPFTGA